MLRGIREEKLFWAERTTYGKAERSLFTWKVSIWAIKSCRKSQPLDELILWSQFLVKFCRADLYIFVPPSLPSFSCFWGCWGEPFTFPWGAGEERKQKDFAQGGAWATGDL